MKGSVGYTRSKITNCANNFLCSGKANALKRWANIGLRCIFLLNARRFHSLKPEKTRNEAVIHAPVRRQKTVKRDLKRNPLWPPRCHTTRDLWKEASRNWSVRLMADLHCLVRRYWKPIYKAFIWRACVGGAVFFVNTVPRYFDWRLKQLVKVWMTPLISLRRQECRCFGCFFTHSSRWLGLVYPTRWHKTTWDISVPESCLIGFD